MLNQATARRVKKLNHTGRGVNIQRTIYSVVMGPLAGSDRAHDHGIDGMKAYRAVRWAE